MITNPNYIDNNNDNIKKRCIVEFIFSRMDDVNLQRFRAQYDKEVESHDCSPAILWILIKDHHQLEHKASIFLIQTKMDNLKQAHGTSITNHIDLFVSLKTDMIA
jgi:hypothetical protein